MKQTKLVKPFNKDDLFQPQDPVVGPKSGGKTATMVGMALKLISDNHGIKIYSNYKINELEE